MADSNIVVSGLTATGGQGFIALKWAGPDVSCLPYLLRDIYEVWGSTTNNRNTATKIVEVRDQQYVHSGLAASQRWYYWVIAKNASAKYSDWHPLSATAGVTAITELLSATAQDLIDFQASVDTQISEVESSTGALASQVTTVSARANDASAVGLLKFTSTAAPSGFTSSIALESRTTLAGALRRAGLYIDTSATLARVRLVGTQVLIESPTGVLIAMFTTDGKFPIALIPQITADKINVTSLAAISATLGNVVINGSLIVNGTIFKESAQQEQFTVFRSANHDAYITAQAGVDINTAQILNFPSYGRPTTIWAGCSVDGTSGFAAPYIEFSIWRSLSNGTGSVKLSAVKMRADNANRDRPVALLAFDASPPNNLPLNYRIVQRGIDGDSSNGRSSLHTVAAIQGW